MDEALRTERFTLKKRMVKIQKEIKQTAKAARAALKEAKEAQQGSKSDAAAAVAKSTSVQKGTIYTRSRGENPRVTLARERDQLAVVERQLQAVQVRLQWILRPRSGHCTQVHAFYSRRP